MTRIAITRGVSPALADCELTHLARSPVDPDRAVAEHAAYEDTLEALGCDLYRLPAEPAAPDCVFVEDTALVFDELAIITHPGAPSRRRETGPVAEALAQYRPLAAITPPATLDGGDVLVVGRRVFVGLTSRTDAAGVSQLTAILEPLGYTVCRVAVTGALHLKSAVTVAAPDLLLLDPAHVDPAALGGLEFIPVAPGEGPAANALRVGETLLLAAGYPGTRARLESRGLRVMVVDNGELAKAEGGLTCCSLLFESTRVPAGGDATAGAPVG